MSRIDAALRDFHALDALASKRTALSGIDPRTKILVTLGFIVTVVSFERYTVAALLPLALFPVIMAALGDIALLAIFRRVLQAAPFAVMVGMFNPLLDQQPLLTLLGYPIAGGWVSFASILIRFCLTVSAALILLASTGFHQVCGGLGRLGVPQVMTTQLLFLYRYAQVLAGEAGRMNLARELRCGSRPALTLTVYGSLLGHLLLRAMARAQRIHQAMLSRGFDGEMRSCQPMRWNINDALWVAFFWVSFVLARHIDLANWFGQLLLGHLP